MPGAGDWCHMMPECARAHACTSLVYNKLNEQQASNRCLIGNKLPVPGADAWCRKPMPYNARMCQNTCLHVTSSQQAQWATGKQQMPYRQQVPGADAWCWKWMPYNAGMPWSKCLHAPSLQQVQCTTGKIVDNNCLSQEVPMQGARNGSLSLPCNAGMCQSNDEKCLKLPMKNAWNCRWNYWWNCLKLPEVPSISLGSLEDTTMQFSTGSQFTTACQ